MAIKQPEYIASNSLVNIIHKDTWKQYTRHCRANELKEEGRIDIDIYIYPYSKGQIGERLLSTSRSITSEHIEGGLVSDLESVRDYSKLLFENDSKKRVMSYLVAVMMHTSSVTKFMFMILVRYSKEKDIYTYKHERMSEDRGQELLMSIDSEINKDVKKQEAWKIKVNRNEFPIATRGLLQDPYNEDPFTTTEAETIYLSCIDILLNHNKDLNYTQFLELFNELSGIDYQDIVRYYPEVSKHTGLLALQKAERKANKVTIFMKFKRFLKSFIDKLFKN